MTRPTWRCILNAHTALNRQTLELTDRDITTLLVEEGGDAIAYAQIRADHIPDCVTGPAPIELWRFYVDRGWHGRGVAQALMDRVQDGGARARREDAVAGRVGAKRPRPRVLCEMWFRRRRRTHILVRHRSADRSGDGHARSRRPMKTRRIIGLSIVATGVIWFQVAGRFEARRIDAAAAVAPGGAGAAGEAPHRQRAADGGGDDAGRSEVGGPRRRIARRHRGSRLDRRSFQDASACIRCPARTCIRSRTRA